MDYWAPKIVKIYLKTFWIFVSLITGSCQKNVPQETFQLPYYNSSSFTPIFIKKSANIKQKIPHTIAPFSFYNQDSICITQKVIENKIHLANFIFTRCGNICPTMTTNLKTVYNYFKKDTSIIFLSYSVTPWIDSPNILKKYTIHHKINGKNWHFLTGNKNEIYKLARQSYFAEEDLGFNKDSTDFLHTEHILLIDTSKRIRGIYNGTLPLEMKQIIEDIKLLKKENILH